MKHFGEKKIPTTFRSVSELAVYFLQSVFYLSEIPCLYFKLTINIPLQNMTIIAQ